MNFNDFSLQSLRECVRVKLVFVAGWSDPVQVKMYTPHGFQGYISDKNGARFCFSSHQSCLAFFHTFHKKIIIC
jgi:hypothetical protein